MDKKTYNSTTIKGKLRVNKYLASSKELKHLVPHTELFTMSNLKEMSHKYKTIYIKLNIGSMGIGVYKVKRLSKGFRLYTTQKRKQLQKHFKTVSALYKHLKSKQNQKMIIQRDVLLEKVNGRPYDIRAMVQRKPRGKWTCTGFLIKVGAPNKIVTNYYQGGEINTIKKLFKLKNYSTAKQKKRTQRLTQNALKISRFLSEKRSGMHEMGIDFAYGRNHKLWVLEVNSNHPQFYPLKKLDLTAYKRMKEYAKSYGRK
jgi:glutathione synthase/RimK-type ligase-like ATP-grasp enzyme